MLTIFVMVAFAANSVIGRAALKVSGEPIVDPATYTTVRVLFGAIALALVNWFRKRSTPVEEPSRRGLRTWFAPLMLTLYAVAFSFAYVGLDTASGTLILFAFVQLTMVGSAIAKGERPRVAEFIGLAVASGGLIYLLAPSLSEFHVVSESIFMMLAGIGWGAYSVLGKGSTDPIGDTSRNFLRSTPLVLLVSVVAFSQMQITPRGFWLAAASGGLTSGLGYVLWYVILPHLRSTQAAAVQLSVPIVAAVGGVLFAGDALSTRTMIAGAIILGGIALTIRWNGKDA